MLNIRKYERRVLITGGAGFIGSHLVKLFVHKYPDYLIINLDSLTYAGNLENIKEVEDAPNYVFEKVDITHIRRLREVFHKYEIDGVIHLAAESHVDRSILGPLQFVHTNVVGTAYLLETARHFWLNTWKGKKRKYIFLHVSTDEVFGELGPEGIFTEDSPYAPRSPYAATKASADHLLRAYFITYNLPTIITNCSNNFGPYQFPEKLIPHTIYCILKKQPIPVYGKGENIRDWIYVEDHVNALDLVFHKGLPGETYLISANNQIKNIDLVKKIVKICDQELGNPSGTSEKLITFVKDRPGHDFRYALDPSKIKKELNWKPKYKFEEALTFTVKWYLSNQEWLQNVISGEYMKYWEKNYLPKMQAN